MLTNLIEKLKLTPIFLLILVNVGVAVGQPRIELSEEFWNFGTVTRGSEISHTIRITNVGTVPLRIDHIRTSCSTCSVVEDFKKEISPGQFTDMKITFKAEGRKGKVTKTIYIDSNDSLEPRKIFRLSGIIKRGHSPEIMIVPNPWYAGIISTDSCCVEEFTIKNDGDSNLIVEKIEGTGCIIEETVFSKIAPGGTIRFYVTFDQESLTWEGERSLTIYSNDPFVPEKKIRIIGEVKPEGIPPTTEITPVCLLIFLSDDCDECIYVMNHIVIPLQKKFGVKIRIKTLSIDDPGNYDILSHLEKKINDTGNEIPVLFIGGDVLGGQSEISKSLANKINFYFSKGGCDFPQFNEAEISKLASLRKMVYLSYFYQPSCKECDRISRMLKNLKKKSDKIEIRDFNIDLRENKELNEAIGVLLRVPQHKRLITPSLVVGDQYLVKDEITDEKVNHILKRFRDSGSICAWREAHKMREEAKLSIIERFKALGPLTVIMGGLVDGINPCAFATIIFFLSYLTLVGRKKKELVYVGVTFTTAVFLTYLLVGMGFYRFIQSLKIFATFSKIVYILTASLAFVLAGYSIYDFIKIRTGNPGKMSLQLPDFIKKRIHKTIRERIKLRRFVLAAFVTGWIVSLLELACTGQVYFPTICFVTSVPELRLHAFLYLVIYNIMFIIPLCTVFGLAYFGTTSEQIGKIMKEHLQLIKIMMAVFFILLGGLLLSVLF